MEETHLRPTGTVYSVETASDAGYIRFTAGSNLHAALIDETETAEDGTISEATEAAMHAYLSGWISKHRQGDRCVQPR